MRDALSELFKKYESQILDGNELQYDAHDKPQNARALYSYLFQATYPPDYLSMLLPEATHKGKNISSKPLKTSSLFQKEFGTYMPHINCISVPTCSAEHMACITKAQQTIAIFVEDAGMVDLSAWAVHQPLTTAEKDL
jgi:hypothetical protein